MQAIQADKAKQNRQTRRIVHDASCILYLLALAWFVFRVAENLGPTGEWLRQNSFWVVMIGTISIMSIDFNLEPANTPDAQRVADLIEKWMTGRGVPS